MLQTIFVTLMGMLETPVPFNFVENLYYMGVGMLGVFVIIGIIVLGTYAISAATKKLGK